METNSLFKIIPYSSIYSWDVKSFLKKSSSFNPNIPLVLFGEFLSKATIKKINIEDNQTYKILGVRSYGKGAFVNREVEGKTLKMKVYQQAKPNHLFWCKVDTKNGAFGIIKEDLANGLGSSNMTFAEIDTNKANVDFIQLFFKSNRIYEYLDGFVTGTTNRKYIRPDQLLNEIYIPLPSLSEQNRIIEAYNSKLFLAEQQERKAKQLEDSIETYLFKELEIEKPENQKGLSKKIFKLIKFSETQRWDALFLLGKLTNIISKYPLVKFSEAIKYFNKGENGKIIRIDSPKFPNDDFRYIGMEHIEKVSGVLLDMPEVKGKEIKSQTLRIPKNFFLYGKLRPYLNKYWINDTEYDNIICSSEFFVFDIHDTIDKLFFKYVLSSKIIQDQISDKTSGARMPRINEDIFFNLQFPLPPIEKQKEISKKIELIKLEIKDLKYLSMKNKEEAILVFENEIFN